MSSQILLLISDKGTLNILSNLLKTEGYKISASVDQRQGRELLAAGKFDLLIVSANSAWDADFDLIKSAGAKQPPIRVIAITESDGGHTAAKLASLGIQSVIEKPLKVDKLLAAVQKAIDFSDAALTDNVNLNLQLETVYQYENIVADSPAMKAICDMISRVAATDIAVLISGEHGTGKGAIARTIHANSRRKEGKFVVVDCSAPDVERKLLGAGVGKGSALEEANGNTLYLREVDFMPLTVQVKLLAILQERKLSSSSAAGGVALDLRLISSSSGNVEQHVVKGTLKSDLYKLLRVISMKVPPLRDRQEDIMPTVRQVLYRRMKGRALPSVATDVVKLLENLSWPGNIKDIEALVDHALKTCKGGVITRECLPSDVLSAK